MEVTRPRTTPAARIKKARRLRWLCFLIALPLACFILSTAADKAASSSWPAAEATVLGSDTYQASRSGMLCVQLRYRYRIGGTMFESGRWSLQDASACYRDRQVSLALVHLLQPGAKVRIRHDPANPARALVKLEPIDGREVFFLILALGLFLIGIVLPGLAARGGAAGRSHSSPTGVAVS